MKHLATIQSEFLKRIASVKWEDLTYKQQKQYLYDHPKSKKELDYFNRKDTKEHYLESLKRWVDHEKEHKNLAVITANFMHKYLPENFRVRLFDEDTGNIPNFDKLVKDLGLKIYIEEQSGGEPKEVNTIVDEKSETMAKGISGEGGFLKIRIATGIHEGKRVILKEHERYGLAPVYQNGKVISHRPYASYGVESIVGK